MARDPGTRYSKALDAHQRVEADLARVLRRWDKSREALRRAEKALDKFQLAQFAAETAHFAAPFNDDL